MSLCHTQQPTHILFLHEIQISQHIFNWSNSRWLYLFVPYSKIRVMIHWHPIVCQYWPVNVQIIICNYIHVFSVENLPKNQWKSRKYWSLPLPGPWLQKVVFKICRHFGMCPFLRNRCTPKYDLRNSFITQIYHMLS